MGSDAHEKLTELESWLEIPDPLIDAPRVTPTHALGSQIAEVPSPPRAIARKRRLVALAASAIWPFFIVALGGLRADADELGRALWLHAVTLAALAVSVAAIALGGGRRGLGTSVSWVAAAVFAVPVAFLFIEAASLSVGGIGDFTRVGDRGPFFACFAFGMIVAVPMIAAFALGFRRAFPSASAWRMGALGGAAGLSAATVLALHCGVTLAGHIVVAHGAPIVAGALIAGLVGGRIARA